jgi:hypothetical protein
LGSASWEIFHTQLKTLAATGFFAEEILKRMGGAGALYKQIAA